MNAPFSFPADAGPFVWILLALAFLALVFVVERAMFLHPGLVLSSRFHAGGLHHPPPARPPTPTALHLHRAQRRPHGNGKRAR